MDANLTEAAFVDFGEDLLYPFARVGLSRVEGESANSLKADVRALCTASTRRVRHARCARSPDLRR